MSFVSRIALACAASLAGLSPVLAADYEPPVIMQQAPEVPVEVGTGWYLRGDVGYALNDSFKNSAVSGTFDSERNRENLFSGSIGVGYHFTDWLRADLNLGYLPGNNFRASYDDGTLSESARINNSAWYGMANVYADLGTYVGVTPYIGAGAGVLRSNPKASGSYSDGVTASSFSSSSPDYVFAYSLDAGLAYRMTQNVSLDLGYQYISAPDAKVAQYDGFTGFTEKKGIHYHQIRLGLRYDLW